MTALVPVDPARLPRQRDSRHAGGIPLYLAATGTVVVPHHRHTGGWDCVVLSDPTRIHPPGATLRLCDRDVETALTVPLGNPLADLPVEVYATVWLARVQARHRGGHVVQLAGLLAAQATRSHTGHLTLDDPALRRLAGRINARPPGLRQILTVLTADGLLTRIGDSDPASVTYRLSLPDQPRGQPPTTRPTSPGCDLT